MLMFSVDKSIIFQNDTRQRELKYKVHVQMNSLHHPQSQ